MATKKDLSLVKQGMQKDKHASQLEQQEYVFALNANLSNESGNFVNISNEHSNILSSKFKAGYKVIGFKNDINSNNTYFFLTNPTTHASEIGFIPNTQNIQSLADIEIQCPTCNYTNILSAPLEETTQTESQIYSTLLADCDGNRCLNFSILHPIKKIEIKTEKNTKSIYFTDNFNPPRYVQLNNLDIYSYEGEEVCGDDSDVIETCLACDKLRMFRQFNIPNLQPETVVLGGRLVPGTYEFLIAYSDSLGNEISEYYSITNPITIFDENNRISDGTERTNFAIKLSVSGLDKSFGYYKIAVVQTNSKQETSYFVEGVHPINDNNVLYTSEQDKKRTELSTILKPNVHVERWEGMTQSNGYLFGYGITVKKEMNLQPVVSLMSSFLRWQTHIAKEELYKDGVANSKYKGFHRDETYAFGIRFFSDSGYSTAIFPFVGRPATLTDRHILANNKDSQSIQYINDSCVENGITEAWQLYNTAEVLGACATSYDVPTSTVTEQFTKTCYIDEIATAPSGTFTISLSEGDSYTNLQDFIEKNKDNCQGYPFCFYLDPTNFEDVCTPNFDDCQTPELNSQEMLVNSVINEAAEKIERDFPNEYAKLKKPQTCILYTTDSQSGGYLRDSEFERRCMPFSYNGITDTFTFQKAFVRNYNFSNESCLYAEDIVNIESTNVNLTGYYHNYKGGETLDVLMSDKNSATIDTNFDTKITKSALWFKGYVNNRSKFILEVSKQLDAQGDDDIAIGQEVRIDIFSSCSSNTPLFGEIFNLGDGVQYYITMTSDGFTISNPDSGASETVVTDLVDGEFFVALDIPVISVSPVLEDPDAEELEPDGTTRYRTAPADGCFSIATRDVEYKQIDVSYDSISFNKKMVYTALCNFNVPQVQACEALPFQYGKFSYTESTESYPDNKELYDSSRLVINETDINSSYREEFRQYFANSVVEGRYVLKAETNLTCSPIRHFKFPDNKISPFMWEDKQAPFVDSIIYPLGVTIDERIINNFLDIALNNNLITQQERDSITGYEIVRGDRTLDKGVVAKGLMYDLMKYTESGKDIYYPNYPYNDLGSDKLNLIPGRSEGWSHPYGGLGNSDFTFHSPETDYNKLTLPNMLKVEGYMFGASKGYFDEVRNHPKMTILGKDAKTLATTLAIIEAAAEIVIATAEVASNAQVWVIAVGGTSTGGGASTGAPAIAAAATVAALGIVNGIASKVGRYRYEWLETFRNLGTPRNFGYYYSSEGYYNYFQPLQEEGEMVRSLQIAKNIKPGLKLTITNEVEGSKLNLNNADREQSVLLSVGLDYPFTYPNEYVTFDNGSVDFNSSSRTYESESNVCATGKSPELVKNIASMYVALKNYVPAQYGTIGSIKWLTTGYRGDLKNPSSDCNPIFGGDVYISRHTLKRKMPMFLTTAMGQADLTPFEYKFYANIGKEPRFYLNYEIDNDGRSLGGKLFPDFDSDYTLDCLTGANGFYIKNPSKFYLYYYGIPNFLVESEINTNFRKAKAEPWENFYPNVGDFMEWTQETVVSIKRDNKFFYDTVYSKQVTPASPRTLPNSYNKEVYERLYDSPNGVMYSTPDNSENDLSDPWLIYRPYDFFQFDTDYGKLKELRGIETGQVLGRFENQSVIFNAVDILVDGITTEQRGLGNGGIFARRPVTFAQTDLGYAGSQTTEMISCEYGHFFADAKRGQVFQIGSGGKGIEEISSIINGKASGMSNWFKEHLPFKMLRQVPEAATDNAYNGLGISMGWDSRYKRVFLTKKDYIPKSPCIEYDQELGWVINESKCGQEPEIKCPTGYTYNALTDKCEKVEVINRCPEGYVYNPTTLLCEREGEGCLEGLDLVFILDATSSQDNAIDNVKSGIVSQILPAIVAKFGSNYRLGLISVKDRRVSGQALYDIVESMSLTNSSTFVTGINTIVAGGGGAGAEPTDKALEAALNNIAAIDKDGSNLGGLTVGTFRDLASKAIILVTDQRPSGLDDAYTFADWLHADSLADQAEAQGVQIYTFLTTPPPTEPTPVPPTVGDNNTPSVSYIMNNYANKTNGEHYFTPSGDGIADNVVDAIVNSIDCTDEVEPVDCTGCVVTTEDCTCTTSVDPTSEDILTPVDINDSDLFEEVSWTIAYSPVFGSWISYYDFKPNYYVAHHNYFQTGLNVGGDEFGLWSHLLTNKSFQVFYGKKYEFVIEYPIKGDPVTKKLNNVELWTEARRNHNDYDYAFSPEITFNRANVYNGIVNSGDLNLVPQKNNLAFTRQYPITNNNNTQDILVSNIDNFRWTFDYFFNRTKSNLNNQPNWFWDVNQINKTVNPHAVSFRGKRVLDRMTGDYFINKLSYDKDSRYNLIFKWSIGETQM